MNDNAVAAGSVRAVLTGLAQRLVLDGLVEEVAMLDAIDEGDGTLYTARVMHPDKATRDRHEAMGFFAGWNTCIDQLEAFARQLR